MPEKKKWFDVEIPLIQTKTKLIGYSLEELNGRIIRLDLTRQLRGKSLEAVIKVKVENGKATGNISKLNLLSFFIRRMMRTGISYVESSLVIESSDSFLKIKPFLITRKKVTRAVQKALRDSAERYIKEYAKDKNSEEIFLDIINNKLQKSLSLKLKKIYPLALCEIRMTSIEKTKENADKIKEKAKKASPEEIEAESKSQIEEIEQIEEKPIEKNVAEEKSK